MGLITGNKKLHSNSHRHHAEYCGWQISGDRCGFADIIAIKKDPTKNIGSTAG
jgi:hypothetical protein